MAYTVAFLPLQFLEFYRADPGFRYQLLQVLQQTERAEYADEQQQRYRFALLDVRNGQGAYTGSRCQFFLRDTLPDTCLFDALADFSSAQPDCSFHATWLFLFANIQIIHVNV